MSIADILKGRTPKKRTEPLWKGPCDVSPLGGITFSMLNRFLNCRERFRLYAIEGLRTTPRFNHKIEYGNMWHKCEEIWSKSKGDIVKTLVALLSFSQELAKQYRFQQEEVEHWYNVCKRQFPIYIQHWSQHPDSKRLQLMEEQVFAVNYTLPSGRTVILRGKWDGLERVEEGKDAGVWMPEHKTKGDPKEGQIQQQLTFDLQTMMYLVALYEYKDQRTTLVGGRVPDTQKDPRNHLVSNEIRGVRYNVVRRPLSGRKGTIRQHQPTAKNPQGESKESFYGRVAEYITNAPEHYFMRWNVEVTTEDVNHFKERILNPILEQLCDWYEWINYSKGDPFQTINVEDYHNHRGWTGGFALHWQHPYGLRNMLDEGGITDYDEFIKNGNEVGLTRTDKLFEELQ